jgi:putative transposase
MKYDRFIHGRRTIRLKDYDYSRTGVYFVTLCTEERECLFGEIVDSEIQLNEFGRIAASEWTRSKEIRKEIVLDEFCVMPNHIHGIVLIQHVCGHIVGANGCSPATACVGETMKGRSAESPLRMKSKSISSFIAGYKSSVTKQINGIRNTPGVPVWQRNYYEHIIRNDGELNRVRQYIQGNPLKWESDDENPFKQNSVKP